MRRKALHFILGHSPHTATVRLAQTLGGTSFKYIVAADRKQKSRKAEKQKSRKAEKQKSRKAEKQNCADRLNVSGWPYFLQKSKRYEKVGIHDRDWYYDAVRKRDNSSSGSTRKSRGNSRPFRWLLALLIMLLVSSAALAIVRDMKIREVPFTVQGFKWWVSLWTRP